RSPASRRDAAAAADLAAGPRRRSGAVRLPRRRVRRSGRARRAGAQLSRRDAGLRQGPDQRVSRRLRPPRDGRMTIRLPAVLPADIPSPSDGVLEIGPLSIHAYGLMIALGVVAAVWLAGRRMEAK